jgi:hypothetical protein
MLSTTTQNQINQEWERKAEAFAWEDKHPVHPTTDVRNDAFRNAMNAIGHKALPFMNAKYTYVSDLAWDAAACADLEKGDTLFLLIRECGTSLFTPITQEPDHVQRKLEEVIEHVDVCSTRKAVLRVVREAYDTFTVSVVYNRV